MVSSALESARSRNLASPAPLHAPSPSTKTTLVATTAAQRIARLQTQIRAMRAEKATMAEELAQIVRGRTLVAQSLERGKKRVRGRGALHAVWV